jgi:putative oxidoreductase
MKIAVLICRVLVGLVFLVFGVNKLHQFIPAQLPPGDAGAWSLMMVNHHWMAVVGIFEAVGGLLLLFGRFVPLGLALLVPVTVNILLFGLLFLPGALGSGIVVALLEIFLIFAYRSYFQSLFVARAQIS